MSSSSAGGGDRLVLAGSAASLAWLWMVKLAGWAKTTATMAEVVCTFWLPCAMHASDCQHASGASTPGTLHFQHAMHLKSAACFRGHLETNLLQSESICPCLNMHSLYM